MANIRKEPTKVIRIPVALESVVLEIKKLHSNRKNVQNMLSVKSTDKGLIISDEEI